MIYLWIYLTTTILAWAALFYYCSRELKNEKLSHKEIEQINENLLVGFGLILLWPPLLVIAAPVAVLEGIGRILAVIIWIIEKGIVGLCHLLSKI
jgi:hypothetical protein